MARTYWSGVGGSIAFGATTFCVVEWSLNGEAAKIDTTNTCDVISGVAYQSFINGPVLIQGSVKAYFDTLNDPFASPISLTLGSSVTLTLNVGSSGKAWVIPARIDK